MHSDGLDGHTGNVHCALILIGKKEKTVNFKPYVFLGNDYLVATKGALTALMYSV
jgi:hypothetical protein